MLALVRRYSHLYTALILGVLAFALTTNATFAQTPVPIEVTSHITQMANISATNFNTAIVVVIGVAAGLFALKLVWGAARKFIKI